MVFFKRPTIENESIEESIELRGSFAGQFGERENISQHFQWIY